MSRPVAVLLLLLCTAIWGLAFVSQKSAMDSMGPLTFSAVRLWLGGFALTPIAVLEYQRRRGGKGPLFTRRQWQLLGLMSVVFFSASWLQQAGLLHTTVTNGGFLTALYVLAVPVIAFAVTRHRPHPVIYVGAPLALCGIFLLNNATLDALNLGDAMIIVSAVFWGGHVFMVGYLARDTGLPLAISAGSFFAAALLSTVFALLLETPSLAGIMGGWVQIAYAGIFSTAVAYSLQAVGQQHLPPSNAAIVLSSESLFAALFGALLLGERLTVLGYLGALVLFGAILLVEAVPALAARRVRE